MRDLIEAYVNRLGRLGRLSGIWLDMVIRSQNQGLLGLPGAIRMILLHGESSNFSTTCPRWLLVGRHMCPDPPMADLVHPLLWPGDPVRVTQTEATCCWTSWQIGLLHIVWQTSWRRDHSVWMVWPSLASLSATTLAGLESVGLWELLDFWCTQSRFSIVEHTVGPTSCLLHCLCMTPLWCHQ